jgi:predicted histidine transporter YuiF (NhaC family)
MKSHARWVGGLAILIGILLSIFIIHPNRISLKSKNNQLEQVNKDIDTKTKEHSQLKDDKEKEKKSIEINNLKSDKERLDKEIKNIWLTIPIIFTIIIFIVGLFLLYYGFQKSLSKTESIEQQINSGNIQPMMVPPNIVR